MTPQLQRRLRRNSLSGGPDCITLATRPLVRIDRRH